MSAITTHVLDLSKGAPGAGISVRLEYETSDNTWKEIGKGTTGADGRVSDLLGSEFSVRAGVYRLTFDTKRYFAAHESEGFYREVAIVFTIRDSNQHYHVPLLLSPFGYSTYRGS